MEKLEIYIPSLRLQIQKETLQQHFNFDEDNRKHMNILHIRDDDRIYIKGMRIESIEVHLISIDLKHNIIAFTTSKEIAVSMYNRIYELLTSIGIDFHPQKLLFITHRPHNFINKR